MENNCSLPGDCVIMLDEICQRPHEGNFPPAFQKGDRIISISGRVGRVLSVDHEVNGYYLDTDEYFSGQWCNQYRLWSLRDVRSGSVLTDNMGTSLVVNRLWMPDRLEIRCILSRNPDTKIDVGSLHPASRTQRKVMKEELDKAGYCLI